ncbi:hypothetical protein PF006_g21499 [Phytophthora fragariae]|uniref:Uncharacterized protein n=1 Tax=Phytophthora fragariae TaxID=53985 RepID=A0A6A3RYZ0_9STRA|nr:hypothetical protein PF006_g21499 [Phytophthora fragariae]
MGRKWFLLVGKDGKALTSATSVDQKPLKSSSAVNEFGKDVSNALIVQVPTQRRVDPATDILPQATGLSHLNRALGFLFKMEID